MREGRETMICPVCRGTMRWNNERFACPVCGYDDTPKPKPKTNYGRLISKTPEELAETYAGGCPNGHRLNCGKYYSHGGRDCFNCWLDWLKSPADKEETE